MQQLSTEQPSLPNRVGKALQRLKRAILLYEEQGLRPAGVRAIAQPQLDVVLLARVLLSEIAREAT